MKKHHHTKLIQEGDFVAEVDVELIESEEGWSPYISISDAYKLEGIRDALQRDDGKKASQFGRIFRLTPVAVLFVQRAACVHSLHSFP